MKTFDGPKKEHFIIENSEWKKKQENPGCWPDPIDVQKKIKRAEALWAKKYRGCIEATLEKDISPSFHLPLLNWISDLKIFLNILNFLKT